ncbi:MAG: hypothetical protein MI862_08730, partial [Desulfobacterales bacterium]|nr:hypothetical protein [Desulfobacterales bacterium]
MELIFSENPPEADTACIERRLLAFNASRVKDYSYDQFVYKVSDESGAMAAGIHCRTCGGWLYIEGLW